MAKKNVTGGQERFDGMAVTIYEGKFSGGFDLDEQSALEIGYGDSVAFVVLARSSEAKFGETRLGDMRRSDRYEVMSAYVIDPSAVSQILDQVDGDKSSIPGQMTLDRDTGELVDEFESVLGDVPVEVKQRAMVGAADRDPALKSFLYGPE